MKYDFTSIMDRHGWDAVAVDGFGGRPGFGPSENAHKELDPIPMWIADMNFPTVPTIPAAIIAPRRAPRLWLFPYKRRVF